MPRISSVSSRNLSGVGANPTIAPAVVSPYRLDNPLTTDSLSFGQSVAISGDLLITGVPATTIGGNVNAGRAYIYRLSTNQLLYTLNNPNAFGTPANDSFGRDVAISGNYAVVTAESEGESLGTSSGKAYVFNTATGQLLHTLNNPNGFNTPAGDLFGSSCAMSGTLIAVGARGESDPNGSNSGKVYIFDAVTGQLQRTLDNPNQFIPGQSTLEQFGSAVAMSGVFLAASAPREDPNGIVGSNSGVVYVFNAVTGQRIYTLVNPDGEGPIDDQFGSAVAISNKYIVVGTGANDTVNTDSGTVYVYSMTTGQLIRTIQNPNAFNTVTDDRFGSSVAVSDRYVYASADGEDIRGNLSGIVYIFDIVTGALLNTLAPPLLFGPSGAQFFRELAVNSRYAIVGAANESSPGYTASSGKIYVYNSRVSVPFYPMLSIPREMEIVKLDWNDGITNTADRSTFARAMTNQGSGHSVVSTLGPYGVTDNIYRSSGTARIVMLSLAGATSDQYFTGTNSWSIEWWGRYNWGGADLDSNVIWGNGVGGGVDLQGRTTNITGFEITLTWSLSTFTTGSGVTFTNIPYTNNTWAHWVVAWEATSATTGRFHIWIDGVRCVNQAVTKTLNMDFFRNANGTAFAYNPFTTQILPGDVVDYRILNNAQVWTSLGDRFTTPRRSFNT